MNTAIRSKTNRILAFICTLAMMIGIISTFGFRNIDANAVLERNLNLNSNGVVTYVAVPYGAMGTSTADFVRVSRMGLTTKFMLIVSSMIINGQTRKANVIFRDQRGKVVMILHVTQTGTR